MNEYINLFPTRKRSLFELSLKKTKKHHDLWTKLDNSGHSDDGHLLIISTP